MKTKQIPPPYPLNISIICNTQSIKTAHASNPLAHNDNDTTKRIAEKKEPEKNKNKKKKRLKKIIKKKKKKKKKKRKRDPLASAYADSTIVWR